MTDCHRISTIHKPRLNEQRLLNSARLTRAEARVMWSVMREVILVVTGAARVNPVTA